MKGLDAAPPLGTMMMPPETYKDKVVYITGGGTGLGRAIATEFARHGAKIAIASRGEEHRNAGIAYIEAMGGTAMGVFVDVRDTNSIAKSFDEVEAKFGAIDILINNAAGNFAAPAERLSANAWNSVISIVLNGTFYCSTEFARRCIAKGKGGVILNIGATYSWTGGPIASHSAAAKAGVHNLTQTLAVEWAADNIRVNTLVPGLFPSQDRSAHSVKMSAVNNRGGETIPAGRVGETHELGYAALYMCSPFASYLTGHIMTLDGGNWLRRYGFGQPEFEVPRERFDRLNQEAAAKAAQDQD